MARRELVERAREFRVLPTVSERVLWDALRDRKLRGVKFRRQMVIGPFIADFCAPTCRLIVEIDGPIHDEQHERDAERQPILEAMGYRVLRVTSGHVEAKLEWVLSEIAALLAPILSPSPSPLESVTSAGLRAMESWVPSGWQGGEASR